MFSVLQTELLGTHQNLTVGFKNHSEYPTNKTATQMLTKTVLLPITFVKNTRVQSTGTRNIGPDKYTYNIIEFE